MKDEHPDSKLPPPDAAAVKIERVHALCEQHLDVAWLWPRVPWGEDLMRQCFERVLELIEGHPGVSFVFNRSTAWSFHIVQQRHPALFARVREQVARGAIALCGGQWVEPDHLLPGGEAMVRQIVLGQWYFQKTFGKMARVCWAPDNFAHAGSLPQILRQAGITGYRLSRCLPQNDRGEPLRQFVWRGLDGSEVYAFGAWVVRDGFDVDAVRKTLATAAAAGLPAAVIKPDDSYSDRRLTLKQDWLPLPAAVDARADMPACRWSSADDIVADMHVYRDRLPVVEGELGFEYTGTYTTDGRYKRKNRMLEALLPMAEKAACWAARHGFPYPEDQLRQAWSDLCLNQFHDLGCGCSFGEVLEEADRLNIEIEARAAWVLEQALGFMCDRLHAARNNEDETAVFSFLASECTAPVLMPAVSEAPAGYADESGRTHVSQRITRRDGTPADLVLHQSRGMQAGIYRRVDAVPAAGVPPLAAGYRLENDFIAVELDPDNGSIVRWHDKMQRLDCLPPGGRGNYLEFRREANLIEHPPWCSMEPWWIMYTGEIFEPRAKVEVSLREAGPLRGCLRVSRRMRLHAGMPETVIIQDIILYRHSPLLHFETHGQWHARRLMLKACFDLPFKAARVAADTVYGVAERHLPQHLDNLVSRTTGIGEEWKKGAQPPPEPDRCMHTWLDLTDGRQGLLALNNGKYGYDAAETRVGLSLMRAPDMRPGRGDILGLGPFDFSYALMPHAGDWRAVDAPRHGYEFNNLPVARSLRPGVDDLAGCQWWDLRDQPPVEIAACFLALRGAGAQITACKRAEDGADLIVRLVECLGAPRQVTLECCRPIAAAVVCDLLERTLDDQAGIGPLRGMQLRIALSAYEIKTLRLRLEDNGAPDA